MTTHDFDREQWVLQLCGALTNLAAVQSGYRHELDEHRQRRLATGSHMLWPVTRGNHSNDLQAFYTHACFRDEERYGPLRSAFAEVLAVLAAHPAWASLVDPVDGSGEFSTDTPAQTSGGSLAPLVAGLMARATELGQDGVGAAASEMDTLLGPARDLEPILADEELTTAYHIALLPGLSVREVTPILDDLLLVPFEQMTAFVNPIMENDIAHNVVERHDWKSIGAIVKPFRWTPRFRRRQDSDSNRVPYSTGSFFDDAEAFSELLALYHALPIVCPAMYTHCIHRTASSLLGVQHNHSAIYRTSSARNFDKNVSSAESHPASIDQARKAFSERPNQRYTNCAPVIARLAEAQARSGRFHCDDRILDVAIALERMYQLDGSELSFRLGTRSACFLEMCDKQRFEVFLDVKEFYNVRSAIVHNRKKQPSGSAKSIAFKKGFDVARRTVIELLDRGPPPDWDEMMFLGSQ